MRAFLRFEDFTTGLALRLSIGFLIIAASLALYQVITRFVFASPSTWSEVITRSAMIWSVFLGVRIQWHCCTCFIAPSSCRWWFVIWTIG